MNRIWRYVLATDNGMAPCAQQGMLSLCCCKPMIRRSADIGDWVIGFVPKRINNGRVHVAWAGQVAESLPLGEYQKRFTNRRDAIYKLVKSKSGEKVLKPLRNDYHADERSRTRDRGGKNALLFKPFWYWGGAGILAPNEIADLAYYHVGQSTKNSSPERIAGLKAWLRKAAEPGIHGQPRDTRQTSVKKNTCQRQ